MKLAYTVNEACAALGIGRTKLYALHTAGEIKFRKVGRATIVERAELERFIASLPIAA